jgi:hypothetical protein
MTSAYGPCELLLAIPEHKTPLPGGVRESQSDVFVLIRHPMGIATYTIEGKVDEPFGPTVGEWTKEVSPGKAERLSYICGLLGIDQCPLDIHYQLLHRTASALIEAERFNANMAGMIVHSFSPQKRWFDAFSRFSDILGGEQTDDGAIKMSVPSGKSLMLGWAVGPQHFREL